MAVNKSNTFVRLREIRANFYIMRNYKTYILFYLFLSLFVLKAKGQIVELDSITPDYFKKYDILFLGEQHNIDETIAVEIKLLNLMLVDSFSMCMEQDFSWSIPNKIVYLNGDTSFYSLRTRDSREKLHRYFFNRKIHLQAIDVIQPESVFKHEILKLYASKTQDSIVKNDVQYFKNIGKIKFPFINKNSEKYGIFLDSLKAHRRHHVFVLGKDTSAVFDFFDALEKGLYTFHDYSAWDSKVFSNYRENFMLKMISKEIDKSLKVISINGLAHVSLAGKDIDIKNDNWTPLASMVKNSFPSKKICSIFLLNPEQDKFFRKNHPKEFAFICNNTKLNKTYIINIDYPDSPFKNLIGKYTHIVVF